MCRSSLEIVEGGRELENAKMHTSNWRLFYYGHFSWEFQGTDLRIEKQIDERK